MKRTSWTAAPALAITLAAFSPCNSAQGQQPAAQAQQPGAPAIEPDAMEALNRMQAYLRTLNGFSLRSQTTIDEVTEDGMKLQFGGTMSMQVRRPDRLHVEVNSDRKDRQLFYDGKTLTLYAQRAGYYASVPAPPTLKEVVEAADRKYGIRLPLADLLHWGSKEGAKADIKEAAMLGPSRIGNAICDHVAVRQEGLDWQIWIEQGKTPLPRKLVITTTTEPSQPQYVAVMQWNTTAKLDAATFKFVPPKNAYPIKLVDLEAAK